MNRFWRILVQAVRPTDRRLDTNTEWLEREEQRQLQEVRDRLNRVKQQLWEIDRRKSAGRAL